MARKTSILPVKMSFETAGLRLAIADINPLRPVTAAVKRTPKYAQIATSIQEIGIIEPPVVAHDRSALGKYLLLDGHLRIEVLKEMGETEVVCIIPHR
jgi:ParB-like chromosome segregation protein Spo0J